MCEGCSYNENVSNIPLNTLLLIHRYDGVLENDGSRKNVNMYNVAILSFCSFQLKWSKEGDILFVEPLFNSTVFIIQVFEPDTHIDYRAWASSTGALILEQHFLVCVLNMNIKK